MKKLYHFRTTAWFLFKPALIKPQGSNMKASQVLPPNYHPSGKFDLKNLKQIIILNLIGLILLIFSIWSFSWIANQIRSGSDISISIEFSSIPSALIALGKLLLTIIFVLGLHEGIHALFFWIFSKKKEE